MVKYMKKIIGKVSEGNKKGREFGFPTANIALTEKIDSGVYRGSVIVGEKIYKSAIFVWPDKPVLEAYLLDFSGDLYGQELTVEIIDKVREVIKFDDEKELIEQIKADVEVIRNQ